MSMIAGGAGTLVTNVVLVGTGVVLAGAAAVGVVQSQESAGEKVVTTEVSYGNN